MHIVANLHFCLGLGPSQNPLVCNLSRAVSFHLVLLAMARVVFWPSKRGKLLNCVGISHRNQCETHLCSIMIGL